MKQLYLILLFPWLSLQAQDNTVLTKALNRLEQNTAKINYLDSIITNSRQQDMLIAANYQLGRIYYKNNIDFALAHSYLKKALQLAKNDNAAKTNILLNLGYLKKAAVKSDSAIYYYNEALKTAQYSKNKMLISRVYSNIANIYDVQNIDPILALQYYKKAIAVGKKSGRKLMTTYNNLGFYFLEKNADSAIVYFHKSLFEARKYQSTKKEIRAYTNLGIAYFENTNYTKAFSTLKKAEQLALKNKSNTYLLYINMHLAKYYELKKQDNKAIHYYTKVLKSPYLKTRPLQYIEVLKNLTAYYTKQANYKQALLFNKKYHQLKDSIFSVQKQKAFNDISTKYEVEKKDAKINLLTKEKELEAVKRKTIIISALALLALLLFVTYSLRTKIKHQKIAQAQKQKLFAQELQTKNALNLIKGQENERARLAKELHDGLGGQLSGVKSMIQTISAQNATEKTVLIDKHMSNAIKNLRNISHDLSANFLKDKPFDVLLHQLIQHMFENRKIETEIALFPTAKINALPERYKLNIYRILQESLQNSIKHAAASFVSVNIIVTQEISLLIEDNGKGFNTNSKANGIGLQNIKDRLQSFNGTLQIDSEPNKGTTLNINIPYD